VRVGASALVAGRSWWGSGQLVWTAAGGGADMNGTGAWVDGRWQGLLSLRGCNTGWLCDGHHADHDTEYQVVRLWLVCGQVRGRRLPDEGSFAVHCNRAPGAASRKNHSKRERSSSRIHQHSGTWRYRRQRSSLRSKAEALRRRGSRRERGEQFAEMAQIGCNLTEEEAEELGRYAAEMELSRPSVCVLVIQRELRRPRLRRLKATAPKPLGKVESKRVTVRIIDPSLKRAFADHVKSCGMGSDDAAAALYREELKERCLFKTLGWRKNQP
jgi:hypothetical protein